jgi:integrase/recombinase XerD
MRLRLVPHNLGLIYIQESLGHVSSKTTKIYTHLSTKNIQQIKSSFNTL